MHIVDIRFKSGGKMLGLRAKGIIITESFIYFDGICVGLKGDVESFKVDYV